MSQGQDYQREKNGSRLDIQGGMNTTLSPDLLKDGQYAFLQNVRRFLQGRTVARPPLGDDLLPSAMTDNPTSLIRLNDATPAGPGSGFALVLGTLAGNLYLNATKIAQNLSGKIVSFITNRPNASPQPWVYSADPTVSGVTLTTINAETGAPASYTGNGMNKIRSDGTIWHTGIAEPQAAPTVTFPGGGSGPTQVYYRQVFRSSVTGAISNPGPESIPGTNAQASPSEFVPAADYLTKTTFNATQWEFVGAQLRTKSPTPDGLLDFVVVFDFGFAIPAGVTIDGVVIDLNWVGQNAGTGTLYSAALYYLGNPIGTAKFPGIANQSFPSDVTQGASGDKWGASLTPDIINDSSFGFGVQINKQNVGGSNRSFLDSFTVTVSYSTQNANVTPTPSTDPQVDKIDVYRQGGLLADFTYVGTTDNSSTPFVDTLADLAAADNPLLEFDNYEPFPGIDLPRRGVVNVAAGAIAGTMAVTWVSGDVFNIRWLPGTIIVIGSPSGVAYTFYNRPSDSTHLLVILDSSMMVPSPATGLTYEIQEPDLAAEPSPVIWGPTPDNGGAFYFGLDPINQGDLLWSKGNNFDSAPQTNRLGVTSGSETMQNGTVTSELSTVFSTERFWLIYPNFSDALATVLGTEGAQWALIQSAATRGLYMRYALDALGAMIAWRAKDSICVSMGGGPEEVITEAIYNLFPHEGFAPVPVTIGGFTVHPPDDTKPNAQTIKIAPGYIFYNYQDTDAIPRTLVYDIEGKGWSVDTYTPHVNCHLWAVGQVDQLLTGCVDGTVRALDSSGPETGTSIIVTRSENGGDARAAKRIGDVFVKALINSPVTVGLWRARITVALGGFSPTSLTGSGSLAPYVIDFTSGFGDDLDDIAATFSWALGSGNILDLWQPDWILLPENTQDRPTDWIDVGPGAMWVKGLLLEADTLNAAKAIQIEDEAGTLHAPDQSPITLNGQQKIALSFSSPFVTHVARIVSTDGVPWRMWAVQWIAEPYAELVDDLVPPFDNLGSNDAKYIQGFLLEADSNNAAKAFTVESGDDLSFHVPDQSPVAFNGKSVKAFTFTPPFVAHSVRLLSANSTPWRRFGLKWIYEPFPESVVEWQTQETAHGLRGYLFIAWINLTYISTAAVTLSMLTDQGQSILLTFPSTSGMKIKQFLTLPSNKFKLISYRAYSSAPFSIFESDCEIMIGQWGESSGIINPFGGQSSEKARV